MGDRVLVAGSAGRHLATELARLTSLRPVAAHTERFPDGELALELHESVRGCEVVLLQATSPPVNDNLVELVLLLDACRRDGAASVTVVLPYFGYARSDYRHGRRGPVGARVAAELLEHWGATRVVAVDVHVPQIEAYLRIPFTHVSALYLLGHALPTRSEEAVLVAPDLGAVWRVRSLAERLDLPTALCLKQRASGSEVEITKVVGDVSGRRCIVIDDMIATGATVVECVAALRRAGAADASTVAATHGVLVGGTLERLSSAGVRHLILTDTVPAVTSTAASAGDIRLTIIEIAPLLATALS
jgi:ribose-phosphate pyrophosphokinase